ncbi:tetratricopeptide repeat protein [Nocardiopsis algeriensis]
MRRADIAWDENTGPFIGPRPFHTRERSLFLGREQETRSLVEAWSRHRLTVLYGGTGAGKTSLLRAGAVPALTDRGESVLPPGELLLDASFPVAAMPDQNPYTRALVDSWDPDVPPGGFPGRSVGDLLRSRTRLDRYGRPAPLYASLDGTELLLRPGTSGEQDRRDLLDELLGLPDTVEGLRLLLVVRSDHMDELRRLVDKRAVSHAEVLLRPFTPEAAADTVERALARFGHRPGPGSGRHLAEELGTASGTVDPVLLQVAGRALWRSRSDREPEAGGVDPALAGYVRQAVSEAATECLVPVRLVRSWLDTLAAAGGAGAPPFCGGADVATVLQDRYVVDRDAASYLLRHPRLHRPLAFLGPLREAAYTAARHFDAACRARTRGENTVAGEHAQRALSAQPAPGPRLRVRLVSLLGDLAFEEGDHVSAARLYADAAGRYASLGEGTAVNRTLLAQARCLFLEGDRSSALEVLASVTSRAGSDPGVQTGLGQALWHAGQAESALDVLNRVLARDSTDTEARRTRGEILADQGEAAPALHDLERPGAPQTPSSRAARALARATLWGAEAWPEDLDEALEEASDNGPVLLRAARVRRMGGDRDLAARLAERAARAHHPPLPHHQLSTAARLREGE